VVVAWRRGRLRAWLAGLLAAVAMLGAVGGLWLVAGDPAGDGAADDAAAPIDERATPDRRDADDGMTGPSGTVPAAGRQRPGSRGPGMAEAAGAWSAGDRSAGSGAGLGSERPGAFRPTGDSGSDAPLVRTSGATPAEPSGGESPSPSIPATTAPAPSVPLDGAATTTSAPGPPPADDSGAGDAGGLGGLLGGVLEVLGLS
jgi:hypothetical protein